MSLFLVAGSMFAQTFPVTSTADAPKYYTVASYNRGGVLTDADGNLQHVATNDNSYWYFTKADDNGGVHFCNLNGKYLQSNLTVGSTADVWYVLANGVNDLGVSISKTNPISSSSCIDAHNYDAGVGTWAPNAGDWEGTTWVFTAIDPIKDIEALLEANKENHSNNPAVGQYSTAAYKALAEAKETVKDPVAAVAAIKAFEMAKQLPLFTIDGGAKDYVVGKSIYDDNSGTLYFKATDKEDLSMLWAFDMAEETVGVTDEVVVRNLGTGNLFWGANFIKVTETNENDNAGIADDGIFLFYTNGTGYPVHAQANGSQVVRWGSYEANSGSAWKFTFVGYTYDIIDLPIVEEEPEVDPNDYTSYIANADLSTGDAWNTNGTKGISGGMVKVASESAFDFCQTITLPAGQYKMTAKAAYRYTGSEQEEYDAIQAGTETHLVKLYAETSSYKYEGDVMNRWEGASETNLAGDGVSEVSGKFVPNSSNAVLAWFNAGQYTNELVFNVQEEGEIKIGITRVGGIAGDYTNIGAWTLTRLGDAEADPEKEPEYTEEDYDLSEGKWFDATSKIVNADLSSKNGWTVSGLENDSKLDPSLRAAEFYSGWGALERPNGHLLQEVTLPAGVYRLTGKAFFRQGNGAQDNPEKSLGYLVAGDNKVLVKTLGSANGTANNFSDGAKALYADETFNCVLEFTLDDETTLNIGYEVAFDDLKSWFIVGALTLEKKQTLKDNFMEQAAEFSAFGQSSMALYELNAVQEKWAEGMAVVDPLYITLAEGGKVLKADVVAAMEMMTTSLAEMKAVVEYYDGKFTDTKWAMFDIQDYSTPNSEEVANAFDEALSAALNVYAVTTVAELEAKVAEMEAACQVYILNAVPTNGYTFDYTFKVGTSRAAWNCTGNEVVIDGITMPENFQDTSTELGDVLWQTVTGLQDGQYTVELWANARVAWRESAATDGQEELTYLFANNVEKSMQVLLNPGLNNNALHVLEDVLVVDGSLKMGMTKKAAGSNWHTIQIKSLSYVGALPLEVALPLKKEAFLAKYAEFEAITETLDYSWNAINENYYFSVQEAAMAVKNDIDNVTDIAVLDEMMAAMDEAVENLAKVAVAAADYNYLKSLLEDAIGFSTMVNEEECMAAYAVFEQYGGMMFGYTASTVEDVENAIVELKAAYLLFISNATPAEGTMFDVTILVVNAEVTSAEGWTNAEGRIINNTEYTGAPDKAAFDAGWWAGVIDIHQVLPELPAGDYALSAIARSASPDSYIYVKNDETEVKATLPQNGDQGGELGNGWANVSTETISIVEGESLTIGVYINNPGTNFAAADNFKLYYGGAVKPGIDTGIENIATDAEIIIYDLSGRRVEKMEKGLYIVNGKKVLVK